MHELRSVYFGVVRVLGCVSSLEFTEFVFRVVAFVNIYSDQAKDKAVTSNIRKFQRIEDGWISNNRTQPEVIYYKIKFLFNI